MQYDASRRTFDCEPTLTDSDVLRFCREGYLHFEGVVPDEINRRTRDYLNGKIPANPSYMPSGMTADDLVRIRNSHEPSSILLEDWFIEHVPAQPRAGGGASLAPRPSRGYAGAGQRPPGRMPGGSPGVASRRRSPIRAGGPFVEVFYFPQDTPDEMGPTEVTPGSHIRTTRRTQEENGVLCSGPAGTIGLHSQSILHRRGASTATGVRPHAEVQLLAHSASRAGLDRRTGFRLQARRLRGTRIRPLRGPLVLLALRQRR